MAHTKTGVGLDLAIVCQLLLCSFMYVLVVVYFLVCVYTKVKRVFCMKLAFSNCWIRMLDYLKTISCHSCFPVVGYQFSSSPA